MEAWSWARMAADVTEMFKRQARRNRRQSVPPNCATVAHTETLETRALLAYDFGDVPDSSAGTKLHDYQTLSVNNGARHDLTNSQTALFLGAFVDADSGASQSITASLDDQFVPGGRDDEDGVLSPIDLRGTVGADPKVTLSATNTTERSAMLYGWIDFNRDGVFENATERTQIAVPSGTSNGRFTLTFPTAPAGSAGTTYARFRLSTDIAASRSTGAATDGEVEDYPFVIQNRIQQPVEVTKTVRISNGLNGGPTTTSTDLFGSVSTAIGDLDGDGVTDMAVGVPQDGEGGTHRGAVQIMFLKSDGTVKKTVKIGNLLNGGPTLANGDGFGVSIASLGDLDGDGVVDLAVGATGDDTGSSNRGAVYILHLNTDGTVRNNIKIASSTNGGPTLDHEDGFGIVASLGDFDGDGVTDIVVGAPFADGADNHYYLDCGAIHILRLQTDGTVKSSTTIENSVTWNPMPQDTDYFGKSITNLGDLDGDGVVDLAVMQNSHESLISGNNSVFLQMLRLNADGTIKGSSLLKNPLRGNRYYSTDKMYAPTSVGDVDSDGVNDLIFAVDENYTNDGLQGWLILALLNTDGTIKSYSRIGTGSGDATPFKNTALKRSSITLLGDLNRDGATEIALGMSNDGAPDNVSGSVTIMSLRNGIPNTAIPPVPVITTIETGFDNPQPELTWTESSIATGYVVWLKNLTTGITLQNSINVPFNSYQPSAPLALGSYEFYVRARNEVGKSAWSPRFAFTVNSVVNIDLVPDGMQTRPKLSWQPLPGAVKFDIWLADISMPSEPVIHVRTSSPQTSLIPPNQLADGWYRLQVRGIALDGTLGRWSLGETFAVRTKTNITHVSNQFTLRPRIQWTAIPGAASYDVWVNDVRTGTVRIQTNVAAGHSYFYADGALTPNADLPVGKYRVWVRPAAADGKRGPWSPMKDFSVGIIPTPLISQTESVRKVKLNLILAETPGAYYMQVWVDDPEPGLPSPAKLVQQYSFSTTFEQEFTAVGAYKVRIRFVTYEGMAGRWSDVINLNVKNSPWLNTVYSSQDTPDQPWLEWSAVADAVNYEVRIKNMETSEVQTITVAAPELNLTPAKPLALGEFEIDVRAIYAVGSPGFWSNVQAFSSPQSTLAELRLRLENTIEGEPHIFAWNPVDAAVGYDIVIRNLSMHNVQLVVRDFTGSNYFTLPTLPPASYEFWIIAKGLNGRHNSWKHMDFDIHAPPPIRPDLYSLTERVIQHGQTNIWILWTPVTNAHHYDLWIADNHGNVVVREADLQSRSYIVTKILPPEFYRIWVRAIYEDDSFTKWSLPEYFSVT